MTHQAHPSVTREVVQVLAEHESAESRLGAQLSSDASSPRTAQTRRLSRTRRRWRSWL